METVISQLLKDFEGGKMSRRQLIQSLALAALAGSAAGSAGAQTRNGFTTMHLDHISYLVPDYRRARDFYAGLMGMAVVGDNGKDYCQLQFGDARVDGARARAFVSAGIPRHRRDSPRTRVRGSTMSPSRSITGTRTGSRPNSSAGGSSLGCRPEDQVTRRTT